MSMLPGRIDAYPTHEYRGYKLRLGHAYPFGAAVMVGGINFSVYSRHATECILVLFERGADEPLIEIPFCGQFHQMSTESMVTAEFRIGHVFTMAVFDIDYENIEYGYRMYGPGPRPVRGETAWHRFDPQQILLDPYAKAIGGRDTWGTPTLDAKPPDRFAYRGRIVTDDFDWESDRPLEIPFQDLIIYEMHVRGFTHNPSSGVRQPGTFAGLRQKIPYLVELGVNCVELMPICEFDELRNGNFDPRDGRRLMNYWGYDSIGFFAPKTGYAASGEFHDGTMVVDELKFLVKELHRHGIEVILDVVFNHTAEGNEYGPTISFRGIDNVTYYMLTPEGYYFNFSGTGNTMNCNHPVVRSLVLDCLRYWVSEFHIDGFRFDLASILGRSPSGEALANPPLLEILALDPVLARCKLIAEAWDAAGLYQVGSFPAYGRWAEWNGKYRDTLRKFLRSDPGQAWDMAQALQGSPNLYAERGPTASINFVTCHDGFTLADLVSYNAKHNERNGEDNRDGGNDNHSWNCGWEGPTQNSEVNSLRRRQQKNALAILLLSHGIPMLLMGDEIGRTQQGNNNAYCHDNELTWVDWSLLERENEIWRFVQHLIAFRRAHRMLRLRNYSGDTSSTQEFSPKLSWHGTRAWHADWSHHSRSLAYFLQDADSEIGDVNDAIYVMLNMYWEPLDFELPQLAPSMQWHRFADTAQAAPQDICAPGDEVAIEDASSISVGGRSVVVLVGRNVSLALRKS